MVASGLTIPLGFSAIAYSCRLIFISAAFRHAPSNDALQRIAKTVGSYNPGKLDSLLAAVSRLLAMAGATKEVAVLASCEFYSEEEVDRWDGRTSYHTLVLRVPLALFGQIMGQRKTIEQNILSCVDEVLYPQHGDVLRKVEISTQLTEDGAWQEKARAWLSGSGVTNQGRVRSDNIASRACDGLLFRSQPEINLYKALKAHGVSFAPLPVFIRGGETYRRIEPDFVVLHEGIVLVIEVDGDTVHQETPAVAHDRTTMLIHEGAYLERVSASECETEATAAACARKLISVIAKLKAARG